MKIPILFKKKKKLQAATRAIPRRVLEETEEPSMRLSSAFLVVLFLHVVAVGGIYAFNSIKTHQGAFGNSTAVAPLEPPAPAAVVAQPEAAPAANATTVQTPAKAADHKPAETAIRPAAQDSGQTYTVVKGDNPVTIAKRFHVNYDELLRLNKIEGPKKLQIGQKLHIPPKIKPN